MHSKRNQNKIVILTRDNDSNQSMIPELMEQGYQVISLPMIRFQELMPDKDIAISNYKWLVFTSKRAVRYFKDYLVSTSQAISSTQKIAVVGKVTAKACKEFLQAEAFLISAKPEAKTLAVDLIVAVKSDEKILLLQGRKSLNILPEALNVKQIQFETLVLYDTLPPKDVNYSLLSSLNFQETSILFYSPSAVDNFISLIPDAVDLLKNIRVYAYGSTTSSVLARNGIIFVEEF